MPRGMVFDRWLFLTAGLLVVGGLFMVGTASPYVAMRFGLGSHHFLVKQLVHALVGLAAMVFLMNVPYRRYAERRFVWLAVLLSFLALIAVLAMPAAGGAHRWLHLGPWRLQPSEFAKLAVVLFMAWILSRKEEEVNDLQAVPLPCLIVVVPMALLVVVEPDLGTAAMLSATAAVMIFVAGLKWRYVFAVTGMGIAGLALGIALQPYRWRRIVAYFDPGADPMTGGWQLSQSLVAIGSGGLTGVGLGRGHQQALFLPEAHTDFIYSVVGEELGFVGCTVLLAAFLVLGWRGLRAARRAPDRFGFYLALGITTLFVVQGLVHMGVCVGMFPTKGLVLPFVSYGGSSLLASMAAMGVLLNVSQHGT